MTTADDAGPHTQDGQDGPQDVQDGQNPHVTAAPQAPQTVQVGPWAMPCSPATQPRLRTP